MKVFSFSLFGDNPIYNIGVIKNVDLISNYFKDWNIFVYTDKNPNDRVIQKLSNSGVIIKKENSNFYVNSSWRFKAISEHNVEVMVCRDTDSRVSERDVACINEWLESDYMYNIIRDHPIGHHWVMNAGMWGAKKNKYIQNIDKYILEYINSNPHISQSINFDQFFLRDIIYPIIRNESLIHDEYYKYESHATKIKHDRKTNDFAFIGESVDENDIPRGDQRSPIIKIYNHTI